MLPQETTALGVVLLTIAVFTSTLVCSVEYTKQLGKARTPPLDKTQKKKIQSIKNRSMWPALVACMFLLAAILIGVIYHFNNQQKGMLNAATGLCAGVFVGTFALGLVNWFMYNDVKNALTGPQNDETATKTTKDLQKTLIGLAIVSGVLIVPVLVLAGMYYPANNKSSSK